MLQHCHALSTHFVIWYQGHLVIPEYASLMQYEMDEEVIFPLTPGSIHLPPFHNKLLKDKVTENTHQTLIAYRESAFSEGSGWVSYNKIKGWLRLYTPGNASPISSTLGLGAILLRDECVGIENLDSRSPDCILASSHVPINKVHSELLVGGILTPIEVATRLIPKMADNLPIYTAIEIL